MKTGDVDTYMQLNYDTRIVRKGGAYYLYAPELQIIAKANSLNSAHTQFERQKRALLERYFEMGHQDRIPLPVAERAKRERFWAQMAPFLLKTAIVSFVAVFLVVAAAVSFTHTLGRGADTIGQSLYKKFTDEIRNAAKREITPEKAAKLHADIRGAVSYLKPFTDDLAPLFGCPTH
jgi:hypothetical protein